ncbi:GNAT family N-acetyltransferase [Acinetobacter sp. ANC 5054]|uniref:GNAT family N-acetyltransferase n=1 Tax=Acinetobacter sp. ANC 5054 TaxID=1977877 RepID=UPI000A33DD61|nr:N-acetyltransferase [Acinetobacter sp. ANC 5054]OTG80853.1 GNAT family N-acetyltransferase [Acinetobacter sp. ANC 5054]
MQIKIRKEQSEDILAIENVTKAAFLNAEHSSHTEHFIVNQLRKEQQLTISLVAEEQQEIVGHVAVSPVSLSTGETGWYGLGPISVLPNKQGLGIGTRLMQAALQELRTMDAAGCVLLGDPNYYARFGFQVFPDLHLANVPKEYFQAISFRNTNPQGDVEYSNAFNATK